MALDSIFEPTKPVCDSVTQDFIEWFVTTDQPRSKLIGVYFLENVVEAAHNFVHRRTFGGIVLSHVGDEGI
jgi:hypothetical protein